MKDAGKVVVDAAQHEWTAVLRRTGHELRPAEPQRAQNGAIERRRLIAFADDTRKRDAQDGASARPAPDIQSEKRLRHELTAGLLACLADYGLEQRFAVFEVACRLVQHQAARGAFLHEQESPVALGDSRHGEIDFQGHGLIIAAAPRGPSKMLLARLRFGLARDPDLVEVIQIAARDHGVIHLDDAFPARGLQPVDEGAIVRDQERGLVVAAIRLHAPDLDMAGDAAREVHELAALVDHPRRVGEQHAHLRVALGEHELLDGFEEVRLVVHRGLEVLRVHREQATCGERHLLGGDARLIERRDDRARSRHALPLGLHHTSLQDVPHPHVEDACLVELFALAAEAELLVKGQGLYLRMQIRVADAASAGLFDQAAQNRCADTTATQTGKYRYAADLTRRIKSPGANWFTVQAREHVNADGVVVVPFVGFLHVLLFDEHGAAYALQYGPVGVPGREHTFYLVACHGAPQRSRASASARPV